ncbi:hypothetical protein ANO14919_022380 [Xylariales sp. No.14919]|nr:hypothetical protein ANO14919_022380 [Xylariales sp. No.14919]
MPAAVDTWALCDRIARRFAKSKYCYESGEDYLPEGSLDDLITEAEISKQLSQSLAFLRSPEKEREFIKFVSQNAKKVFAIATLGKIGGEKVYRAVNDLQITDEKLPIDATDALLVELLGRWDAEQFGEHQWKFLAPVFNENILVYHLDKRHILPLMDVGSRPRRGTFGLVSKVKIHEAHQKHRGVILGGLHLAVKEIVAQKIASGAGQSGLDEVKREWQNKAKALDRLSEVKHQNLVPCIAAIGKKDKYYFLFPWADGGSLQDFWEKFRNPILSPEFVGKVLVQIRGLAEALKILHNYRGRAANFRQGVNSDNDGSEGDGIRHGGLKPENILRFAPQGDNDIGTLKIADLGLAKYHDASVLLEKNARGTNFGAARYEEPEVTALRLEIPALSCLYDMWSMGCIILELLIWLLHGTDKLQEFKNAIGRRDLNRGSSYCVIEENHWGAVAKVHDVVANYIKTLAEYPACAANTALGDLLSVVETKLLVVELPPPKEKGQDGLISVTAAESTKTNSGPYRASASSLLESLDDIIRKCTDQVGYLCTERD